MIIDNLRKELVGVVGVGNISVDGAAPSIIPAAWDVNSNGVDGAAPSMCVEVAPNSAEEVYDIVKIAERDGNAIIPTGGANQLYTGYPPISDKPWILLSTRRMNRVLDHQPDDLTITCESGVTLRQVEEALMPHRQTLALDGPLPETSTLGGLVATATAGIRRHAYGTPRDLLIGLRAMMTGSVEIKGGGKVVKNVAGYDVCKLFAGSWGSLGVLTELTFKIRPLPESRRTIVWYTRDVAAAVKIGFELHLARLAPTMILATNDFKGRSALIVGIEGVAQRVQWQVEEFCRKVSAADIAGIPTEISTQDVAMLNDWPAIKSNSAPLALRAACLPSELEGFVGRLAAIPTASILADCTAGTLHCTLEQPASLREVTSSLPPSTNCVWTRLNIDESEAASISRWGVTREDAHIHRSIKATLDPSNTFSPGRFPGAS